MMITTDLLERCRIFIDENGTDGFVADELKKSITGNDLFLSLHANKTSAKAVIIELGQRSHSTKTRPL